MKLRHVMLRVYDINKSLDFYSNVMKLEVKYKRELKDATVYYLAEKEGDPFIALCYNHHHPEQYSHGTYFAHIAYTVDSLKEFGERLKAANLDFERDPFEMPDGQILAFIKDPDGHPIELIEFKK